MKIIDLSGQWNTAINDGSIHEANLPGTLDENGIGYQDNNPNQWKSEEAGGENNALLNGLDVITTRLTRAYTYEGVAVFSREVTLKAEDRDKRVFLEVERTRSLVLQMNGQVIKPYYPGTISTPYIFEVTSNIMSKNKIELLCDNSYQNWPHDEIIYSSAATDETQTNWNGILGFLRLRMEEEVFISNIRVYPKNSKLTVKVEIDARLPYKGLLSLKSSILKKDIEQMISIEAGVHTITFEDIAIENNCRRWDEFEGNLYEICVSGNGLENKKAAFGVRDFSTNESGRLALNGRAIFLRCEANCCVFPETGHMPLTVGEWIEILNMYKSYGINCVRFHSHCPPDAAFTAADSLGILMQPELSHWNPKTAFEDEKSWNYYRLELEQIILTYANHPSFVMLTFGNELQADRFGHERIDKLLTIAKTIDSTRMYASGSNVHYGAKGTNSNSDFYTSSNFYEKHIRGTSSGMTGYINECYPNAKTNYNKEMKALRTEYAGPVFSFEVGQYEVLPDFDEIDEFNGVTVPNNFNFIKNQVIEKGFYPEWKKRVEATGELARIAYREEIEAVLRTRELSGISLLGLQDFPGQGIALVGMLNSHLQPKPFDFAKPEKFRAFFKDVVPLVLLDKYTYTNKETLSADIEIANYGKQTITAPIFYELRDGEDIHEKGMLPAMSIPSGDVTVAGSLSLSLKEISSAKKLMLTVTIYEYMNEYPIWVYPDNSLDTMSEVIITKTFDETERELLKGKKVFYSPAADIEHFPHSISSQFTTDFWSVGTFGNQSGCMGCLLDPAHPVFSEFPTESHSNWQWWPMSKGRALIIPDEIEPLITVMDCYARLRKLAFLFECNVGNGKLMVSSMGLLEHQEYPEVRALTNSIISYMNSEEFAPKQNVSLELLKSLLK